MSNIDKQALRERYSPKPAPECHICGKEMTIQRISSSRITYGCTGATYDDNGCHYTEGRSIADDHYEQSRVTIVDVSDLDVLALLDENIQLQREKDAIEAVALALRDDMRQAREQLEEVETQIVELPRAASVNSQWKPDVCPVTGRRFFMWIEHETLGYVPTYGGPFDSYTIPSRDSSGEFSCERYDHDLGGWVGGEFIGLYLIDDDEQCRVCELEERIAELEHYKSREERVTKLVLDNSTSWDALYKKLEAAERRITELESKLAKPVLLPKTNG
ncbi:ead/Ea22-like family protein [Salmonella enterica]|nr:ead/Ea22-like family protein [Salmonella enterica]EBP3808965.1 ead/Ea22-like family protein [Salmonella enterica subsp. enterica]